MKERPVLMSGPMVRACLREIDPKTQTRRVVLPLPPAETIDFAHIGDTLWACIGNNGPNRTCPYGTPGDRLWVKETFASSQSHIVAYRADGECGAWIGDGDGGRFWNRHGGVMHKSVPVRDESWRGQSFGLAKFGGKWKPSIFMPRSLSRLTLEVTEVRVERLQAISEADAMAEGACVHENPACRLGVGRYMYAYEPGNHSRWELDVQTAYRKLWDSLNAKRGFGWDVNPWVWVVAFNRVTS